MVRPREPSRSRCPGKSRTAGQWSPNRPGHSRTCRPVARRTSRPAPVSTGSGTSKSSPPSLPRRRPGVLPSISPWSDCSTSRPPSAIPIGLLDLLEAAWEETLESEEYRDLFAEEPDRKEEYYQGSRRVAERYFQVEDPREIEPLEREKLITLLIDAGRRHNEGRQLEVRGIIDRLDPGPDGDFVITDYKTGKAPPLNFSDSSFFALKIYALMVQQNSGRTPALVRLVYLGNSVAYSQPVSDRQLRSIRQQLQALWLAIDRAIAADNFPTRKTRLCGWCSYQPICPAWVDDPSTVTNAGAGRPAPTSPAKSVTPPS